MKYTRSLTEFWNWLPGFRAIAETEHLPTAAAKIHVSPPALSRTLRLLESHLDLELFDRVGRRLELNDAGRTLLMSVRLAMRLVHEGVQKAQDVQLSGAIHISVPGPFAPIFVLPAIARLSSTLPELTVHMRAMPSDAVNDGLKRGEIDVALLDAPEPDPALTIRTLAHITHDLYIAPSCAPTGDSWKLDALPPFVAPQLDAQGRTPDAWPLDRPRRVSLRVLQMQVALDAVKTGRYIAVLPTLVGDAHGLTPLGVPGLAPTTLYLVHRPSLPLKGSTEYFVETLEEVLEEREVSTSP